MKKNKPRLFFSIIRNEFLAITIAIGIGFFIINNQIVNFVIDNAVKNNNDTANAIETFFKEELDEPLNVLTTIDMILLDSDFTDVQINNGLNKLKNVYQYFDDIEIIDFNGKVLFTLSDHNEEIGFDRSNEISINVLNQSNDDVYWSNIDISPYSNARTISIALNSKLGYIIGYLNLDFIQETSYEFISKLNSELDIVITDQFGTYLVYKDRKFVDERRIYEKINYAKSLIKGTSENIYLDGNKKIIMSSIQMKHTNWIVNVEQTYASATKLMYYFTYFFIIFIIILITTFILVSLVGVNRIIRNISNFSNKLISFHDPKKQHNHDNYFQEFDLLELSYNNMVDSIAEKDLRLEKLAFFDSLTGMFNRTYLIDNIIPKFKENTNEYAVIFIDLDNFSYINDTYGHEFGDMLIVEFSTIIKKIFIDEVLIRLGGDEFIIIVNNKFPVNHYIEDRLIVVKGLLEKPLEFSHNNICLTFSAGYSRYPNDGFDFYDILKNADSAMYHAKSKGKNSTSYFVHAMKLEVERKLNIEQQLRKALDKNEFTLVFQPQISVESRKIRGFEALIRWNNSLLGDVLPIDFIKIAEENRFINEIGQWVIEEACKFIKKINEELLTDYIICINASPIELKNENYARSIKRFLSLYNIKANWLEIEITENISIEEFNSILPQLLELKLIGISLAIDDFGTGYSSLSYLQNMPLDVLKIDRMFINQIEYNSQKNLMIQSIILLAKNLNLKIVAEGVETQNQMSVLEMLGCEYVQGYLVSKPISFLDLIEFIKNNQLN